MKSMKLNVVIVLFFAAVTVFGNCDALGQFVWTKDILNPVLSGGGTGAWDNDVNAPWVIFDADSARYEMWYTGLPSAGGKIGFAVNSDGVTWEKELNPVLSPSPGTWDSLLAGVPCVIRENGQYKMWYTGKRSLSGGTRIGYATSPDGRNWTKYAGNPVFTAGPGAWEAGSVSYCSVIKSAVGYVMFYTGCIANGNLNRIGRATSVDGITWQRDTLHNPVLNIGGTGAWDGNIYLPRVLDVGGKYYMWYTAETVPGDNTPRIGLATSVDSGKTWVKYAKNPVLTAGPSGSWDEKWVELGSVLLLGDTFEMWYDGGASPAYLARVGHATAPFAQPSVWELQNSNLPSGVSVASLSAPNNQVCWASGVGGTKPYPWYSRTTNGGNTWVCDSIPGAENGYMVQIVALDADTAYAAVSVGITSNSKGVYKTTNGGATWTKQNAYASSLYGPSYIYFFDAHNGVAVGDANLETYTTTNGGLNWNPVNMPAALNNEFTWGGGNSIAGAGNRVWFGTTDRIFRSTDRGYTWSAGSAFDHNWQPSIAFQDSNTGIYSLTWVPTTNFYRKTTDGGVTWNALANSGIGGPTCIRHVPGTKRTYLVSTNFIGSARGFASTYNEGQDWRQIDNSDNYTIAFSSDSVGWGAPGNTNAIYRYIGPRLILSVESGRNAPASYLLAQNYPNPFNPSTTIKYELPRASHVSLTVYDILGREVSVLVNDRREAGVHEVKFDGSGLASGVYFYKLQAGPYVAIKKLLLTK